MLFKEIMVRSILSVLFVITTLTTIKAQTTEYKNKYFAKQVNCSGKKFKKVQSTDSNGTESIKTYCSSNNKLVDESYKEDDKPVGVWRTLNTDGAIIRIYDFDALVYLDSAEKNIVIKDTSLLEMAIFPQGGLQGFQRAIAMETRYPNMAKDAGISGIVYMRGIIEETGKFRPHSIIQGTNPYLDAEAWRVFSNMPKWKPATYEGNPIWIYISMPLKFSLN
jgi:TonB family protein